MGMKHISRTKFKIIKRAKTKLAKEPLLLVQVIEKDNLFYGYYAVLARHPVTKEYSRLTISQKLDLVTNTFNGQK